MLSKLIETVNLSRIWLRIKEHKKDIILIIIVLLLLSLSFAAGFIVAKYQDKEPIRFETIK